MSTEDKTPSLGVRQIARTSAAEAVREQLLALIQGGELTVGDKLPSEHDLAGSFGVSRPVVREALGALRAAGVVESRSGSGTYVTAVDPTPSALRLLGRYSLQDLFEVRMHLEVPGAGLAAERRTNDQLAALWEIVRRHETETDPVAWIEDDLRFHVLLADATANALQAHLVREIRGLQHEQNVVAAQMAESLTAPLEEHTAIVRAVERRDAGAARAAMAAHLQAILDRAHEATVPR